MANSSSTNATEGTAEEEEVTFPYVNATGVVALEEETEEEREYGPSIEEILMHHGKAIPFTPIIVGLSCGVAAMVFLFTAIICFHCQRRRRRRARRYELDRQWREMDNLSLPTPPAVERDGARMEEGAAGGGGEARFRNSAEWPSPPTPPPSTSSEEDLFKQKRK